MHIRNTVLKHPYYSDIDEQSAEKMVRDSGNGNFLFCKSSDNRFISLVYKAEFQGAIEVRQTRIAYDPENQLFIKEGPYVLGNGVKCSSLFGIMMYLKTNLEGDVSAPFEPKAITNTDNIKAIVEHRAITNTDIIKFLEREYLDEYRRDLQEVEEQRAKVERLFTLINQLIPPYPDGPYRMTMNLSYKGYTIHRLSGFGSPEISLTLDTPTYFFPSDTYVTLTRSNIVLQTGSANFRLNKKLEYIGKFIEICEHYNEYVTMGFLTPKQLVELSDCQKYRLSSERVLALIKDNIITFEQALEISTELLEHPVSWRLMANGISIDQILRLNENSYFHIVHSRRVQDLLCKKKVSVDQFETIHRTGYDLLEVTPIYNALLNDVLTFDQAMKLNKLSTLIEKEIITIPQVLEMDDKQRSIFGSIRIPMSCGFITFDQGFKVNKQNRLMFSGRLMYDFFKSGKVTFEQAIKIDPTLYYKHYVTIFDKRQGILNGSLRLEDVINDAQSSSLSPDGLPSSTDLKMSSQKFSERLTFFGSDYAVEFEIITSQLLNKSFS